MKINSYKNQLEFWDDFALNGYDYVSELSSNKRLVKQVLNSLVDCKKVLDIGCGTGNLIIMLAKQGKAVYGIDNSQNMLLLAKRKIKSLNIKANLGCQDATNLNFKNNSFDAVSCINVLFNLENPELAIQEVYRVLSKKGIFVVSGPMAGTKITKELKEKVMKDCNDSNIGMGKIKKIFRFNDILFKETGIKFLPSIGQLTQLLVKNRFKINHVSSTYYGTNYFIIAKKDR